MSFVNVFCTQNNILNKNTVTNNRNHMYARIFKNDCQLLQNHQWSINCATVNNKRAATKMTDISLAIASYIKRARLNNKLTINIPILNSWKKNGGSVEDLCRSIRLHRNQEEKREFGIWIPKKMESKIFKANPT